MGKKELPVLNHMLLNLILRRLFLPLLVIWIAVIVGVGYFLIQTLVKEQQQIVRSMAQMIDRHLDQGGQILDAVARVAEVKTPEEMGVFMQSTWEAYRHFDTLYYLDGNSQIALMVPYDSMYLGLDMSNLPDFQHSASNRSVTISRPFISLRTGAPTVYLVKSLSSGGCVVGELSLRTFENEIARYRVTTEKDSIFIFDQSGTLLAHPTSDLVRQQMNMSYLEIFQKGRNGDATLVYDYDGRSFLGNAVQVRRVGWVIVDQIPLLVLLGPYAMTFGMTILLILGIWLALVWSLRKKLQQNVVAPLVQLSQGTEALAIGDYSKVSTLVSMPMAFVEIEKLVTDFQRMSSTLEIRQTALKESEERYRELFEKVPTGLFRFNVNGDILDVNHAYVQMFGFPSREALIGIKGFDLFLSQEECKQWQATVEQGKAENVEIKMRRYNSAIIWVDIRCLVVRDREQEILYYDGSMVDITKQKYAEGAIQMAYQELESEVKKRTRELAATNSQLAKTNETLEAEIVERIKTEAALKKARDQAQAANAAKSQFLANMSHEIRTPMNGIIGMTDLTLMSELDSEQREFLTIVRSSSASLLRIINDILDYSKIEAGKMNLEHKPFNIRSIFGEVVELFRIVAEPKGMPIKLKIHNKMPHVVIGDSVRLRQVLSNLVGNAVKFTDKGEITITADCEQKNNQSIEITVMVADTGIGIAEDKIEKLFKRFSQVDDSTTRQFGGTGLGLAISQKLIEMMDGHMWVESTESIGSKFFFTAVLGVEKDTVLTIEDDAVEGEGLQEKTRVKAKRILVVEDDKVSRNLICIFLRKKGMIVHTVENGKEAVAIYNREPFDLILMDISMPYLDGYTATGLIREAEKKTQSHIPIIAVTAEALAGDKEKCIASGMDDYISKPIDIDYFNLVIEKWLS